MLDTHLKIGMVERDINWGRIEEHVNSMLELPDKSLERTVSALHEAHGTGGYR